MKHLKWLWLIILSFGLGVLLVQFLTVHPLKMSAYLLLSCVTVFVLIILMARSFATRQLPIAVIVSVIVLLGGYLIRTKIFLAREDDRPVPELVRGKGEPGDGHTAVIYFTHGEPETYDPIGWINQFNEFDEQGISFIPLIARPIFVQQLRAHYLQVGTSHHRQMHMQMLQSLENACYPPWPISQIEL